VEHFRRNLEGKDEGRVAENAGAPCFNGPEGRPNSWHLCGWRPAGTFDICYRIGDDGGDLRQKRAFGDKKCPEPEGQEQLSAARPRKHELGAIQRGWVFQPPRLPRWFQVKCWGPLRTTVNLRETAQSLPFL
jgi:hypothetical protein